MTGHSRLAMLDRGLAVLIAAGIAVQFFLAGAGAFGATGYGAHRALGIALLAVATVALIVSPAARRDARLPVALVALLALQLFLGWLGTHHSWFGALHGLTALAVAGAAATNSRRTMKMQTPLRTASTPH